MIEIEAKLRVDDLEAVRLALTSSGGQFVGRYIEHNHILDRSDGDLREAGCGLRVRAMDAIDGEPAAATLTFKGAVEPSTYKRRTEIQTTVGDAGATIRLLTALGFIEVLSYRKVRESWKLGGCCVELDEVPLLGKYVEIEGDSEAVIGEVQRTLGLDGVAHVSGSYVRMLVDACERLGRSPIGVGYDEQGQTKEIG